MRHIMCQYDVMLLSVVSCALYADMTYCFLEQQSALVGLIVGCIN